MRDDLLAHLKRWNIDLDAEEELNQLKFRLRGVLHSIDVSLLHGSEVPYGAFHDFYNYLAGAQLLSISVGIGEVVTGKGDIHTFVHQLQLAFLTLARFDWQEAIELLASELKEYLELSPKVGIEVVRTDTKVTLYPKGAKLLDATVVNQTLAWLDPHPKALLAFEKALKLYMEGDKGKHRNLLDNLRFSIEQLLKDVLGNGKSLENQQGELLPWLKARGVHDQTVNMYQALLFGPYSKFQNQAVKHDENFSESEIEFTIYLTGTFMRLLLQLENEIDK